MVRLGSCSPNGLDIERLCSGFTKWAGYGATGFWFTKWLDMVRLVFGFSMWPDSGFWELGDLSPSLKRMTKTCPKIMTPKLYISEEFQAVILLGADDLSLLLAPQICYYPPTFYGHWSMKLWAYRIKSFPPCVWDYVFPLGTLEWIYSYVSSPLISREWFPPCGSLSRWKNIPPVDHWKWTSSPVPVKEG